MFTINAIFRALVALLLVASAAGTAFAVDLTPIGTITASPNPAESVSVIVVVGADSGDSAGIDYIELFEDGTSIATLACGGATSCTLPKSVSHSAPGVHSFYAKVGDITGHVFITATITVSYDGDNVPPVLAPIGNKATTVGTLLTFPVTATDANPNDVVTLSAAGLPAGATFTSGTFSWTPAMAQIGNHTVTFTATDPHNATDNETINIEVTFTDTIPPGFSGGPGVGWSGDLNGTTGDPLVIFANTTDNVDVTSAAITFSGGFAGTFAMTEGPANYFTYALSVPCCSLAPIFYTITATDAASNSNTTPSSTITVSDNDAPTAVISNGNISGFVGIPIAFDGSASTDNIGIVSYSWNFGDSTTATGATPSKTYATNGTFTVTLNVTDAAGNSAVTSLATITATIVFDTEAPAVTSVSFTNPLTVGSPQVITATITDNSGVMGIVVVELNNATNFTMTGAGSTFTATIPAASLPLGIYTFEIIASDFVGNVNGTFSAAFDVVPAPAPPPAGGGGGSGGGGGGRGGGRPLDRNSANFCWGIMNPGEYKAVVPSFVEIPVTEITFKLHKEARNVCMRIEGINTTGLPSIEKPYKAVNITATLPAEFISDIEIKYRVQLKWVVDNQVRFADVALARLAGGEWNRLNTSLLGSDDNYTYHASKTPGFSKFIVFGAPIQTQPVPETEPEPQPPITGEIVVPSEPWDWKSPWSAVIILWLAISAMLIWGWAVNLVPKSWTQGTLDETPMAFGEVSAKLKKLFDEA